jgi:hypothetical protein
MRKTKGSGKTRRYRGGGLGQSYTLGAPLVPGVDTGISFAPTSSCMAAARPGMIEPPQHGLGLPGMSGGRRRRQSRKGKGKRKGSRRQRGGRYTFDLTSSSTFGGTPWGSGIPQVAPFPCEAARTNPLNAVQKGGVGGVDSALYNAPTAGYTNTASTWVGSTGAPSMLQTPYDARTLNPACMKTGGARRRMTRGRRGTRGYRRRR